MKVPFVKSGIPMSAILYVDDIVIGGETEKKLVLSGLNPPWITSVSKLNLLIFVIADFVLNFVLSFLFICGQRNAHFVGTLAYVFIGTLIKSSKTKDNCLEKMLTT